MNRKTFRMYMLMLPFSGKALSLLSSKTSNRYLLNRFSVAGFQYHKGMDVINKIKVGDTLKLLSEPKNIHDEFAVCLEHKNIDIGYIPKSDNKHISRLLSQGLNLHCQVFEVDPEEESWHMCKVEVYLIT